MHCLSIKELAWGLKKREFSSIELTKHYLQRIFDYKSLNAFIHYDEKYAMEQAKIADNMLKNGKGKVLTGIPMAHKDIFCTKILPTTCASKMLANFTSPYDATIVAKLAAEGAVLLGKTNMDEFGMGSTNENSFFGPVLNPWDSKRVPGGSSGGSAAAVAASLAAFATGSDTGGSIRQPSAFCGISGIKPTYGMVSRFGLVAFASSLDQAGPMAKSVEDLALILPIMAGHDPKDSTSINKALPDYHRSLEKPVSPLKIGLPKSFFEAGVDKAIQQNVLNAVTVFEKAGAEVVNLDLGLQHLWVPCYYVIACAEASSNLSRYDGIRFGHRSKAAGSLLEMITQSRNEGFGLEVKRRILTGTHVLSAGYFDAYYLQALKIRRLIQEELEQALNKVDVIMGPTTPTSAFRFNEKTDPIQVYLSDVFTVAANLAGLPALSIPCGFSEGLPIGLQLMGNHFSEQRLFQLGNYYQQVTDWHKNRPLQKGDL